MKKLIIMALLASVVSMVSAQTLRVVLWYEADPSLPEASAVELSEAVIQGALDACFESGLIGTNDRPRAGTLDTTRGYKPGNDAIEGFVDYELVVFADFRQNGPEYKVPVCTYRLIRVSDLTVRYSDTLPAMAAASMAKADIDKASMRMGAEMIRLGLRGR
jgi:hypothetical protein